ncbi:hypothetical protein [Poriferisphaera corsica]|nr:hypothetical protein [Poriferisphaera corsica]
MNQLKQTLVFAFLLPFLFTSTYAAELTTEDYNREIGQFYQVMSPIIFVEHFEPQFGFIPKDYSQNLEVAWLLIDALESDQGYDQYDDDLCIRDLWAALLSDLSHVPIAFQIYDQTNADRDILISQLLAQAKQSPYLYRPEAVSQKQIDILITKLDLSQKLTGSGFESEGYSFVENDQKFYIVSRSTSDPNGTGVVALFDVDMKLIKSVKTNAITKLQIRPLPKAEHTLLIVTAIWDLGFGVLSQNYKIYNAANLEWLYNASARDIEDSSDPGEERSYRKLVIEDREDKPILHETVIIEKQGFSEPWIRMRSSEIDFATNKVNPLPNHFDIE